MSDDKNLEIAMALASEKAALEVAEKHFFDEAQPFFPLGFSVCYRNPGHWDVMARECPGRHTAWEKANPGRQSIGADGGVGRAFAIRGEPGKVILIDERWNPHVKENPIMTFKSVMSAMLWVCEEMMQEPPEQK